MLKQLNVREGELVEAQAKLKAAKATVKVESQMEILRGKQDTLMRTTIESPVMK